MKTFKNAWFERFARKQSITDATLLAAVAQAERGLIDADLGNGVIKLRLARAGQGKSGSYRTIILYRAAKLAVFVYGFAKSDRSNLSHDELAQFKKAASHVLALSEMQLTALVNKGLFSEVHEHGKQVPE